MQSRTQLQHSGRANLGAQAKEIMKLFSTLTQQGTTIVQVTHAKANAAYGSRMIQLRDGWMVSDTSNPERQPYEAVEQ